MDHWSILKNFLQMPWQSESVLDRFAQLPYAMNFRGGSGERFIYVPGQQNMPLLCAHADVYAPFGMPLEENQERFFRSGDLLGADDRAGCALLWEFRNSGCGMLIFDGEERGCCASKRLCSRIMFPYTQENILCKQITQCCSFILSPDLSGSHRWKHYGCTTENFQKKMNCLLKCTADASGGWTDAAVLGSSLGMNVCNLAIGCTNPHTTQEFLNKADFLWCRQQFQNILNQIKKGTL